MEAKPHVLAIPVPLQGHLNPMLQLCNLLISKGIRVTLLVTSLVTIPEEGSVNQINIERIPDAKLVPEEGKDPIVFFLEFVEASIRGGFHGIVEKYRDSDLKGVVYDSGISYVLDLVHAEGLKGAALFTQHCVVSSIYYHVFEGNLETPVDVGAVVRLPGLPEFRGGDLPSFVYDTASFPILTKFLVDQYTTFEKADWRLFNTFHELEHEVIEWLSNKMRIHIIGPTVPCLYEHSSSQGNNDYGLRLAQFKSSNDSYIEWLDEKQDKSVVYVSFGSLSQFSEKQFEEVACALNMSGVTFLWSARESEQLKFPPDFKPDKDRGLVVDWCSQIRVLSHRAVACFVTHGGWNSTLEGICVGVPLVALPQWGDQITNAKLIADTWGIGVRAKSDLTNVADREHVSSLILDVLQGKRAGPIRTNVYRLKKFALDAVAPGGSSYKDLADFVDGLRK